MARTAQDVLGVLRGLQIVAEACGREHLALTKHLWSNSSVRELLEANVNQTVDALRTASEQPSEELKKAQALLQETGERGYVVAQGLSHLLQTKIACDLNGLQPIGWQPSSSTTAAADGAVGHVSRSSRSHSDVADAANLDISSITLLEFEEILSKRNMNRNVSLRTPATPSKQLPTEPKATTPTIKATPPAPSGNEGILSKDTEYVDNLMRFVAGTSTMASSTAAKTGMHEKHFRVSIPLCMLVSFFLCFDFALSL